MFRSDGTAAGTIEIATNVDIAARIGYAPQPSVNDMNGDARSDILWRSTTGTLASWTMNGGSITSSGALISGGIAVAPDASWSIAGISDFNGDGNADALWRNSDGTLADWLMNGSTIMSGGVLNVAGTAVKPDATWSVVGTGDFDGNSRADILWRKTDGTITEWNMNGSSILGGGAVFSNGSQVKPDSSWSVAGIGDFNGDNRKDVLWRNTDGTIAVWTMNGSTIASSDVLVAAGAPVKPDASWLVAGIGDFNADGNSDLLWRNSTGALAEWQMNGSTIASSGSPTLAGIAVTPDATWHIIEIGDFNGNSNSDILWRNDNGALAEWLMNGTSITSSVPPNLGGASVNPDATWIAQAKPTDFS